MAIIASRSDVHEELDRLIMHSEKARSLLLEGEPIGRRLEFIAQELAREANTLCSKAASSDLGALGLDIKNLIDQFREQVQNVE